MRATKDICKDVAEALVGFANAHGCELTIGVENDGGLSGTNEFSSNALSLIKQAPSSHVHKDTPLQSVLCRDTEIDGKRIIYFRVPKGARHIHSPADNDDVVCVCHGYPLSTSGFTANAPHVRPGESKATAINCIVRNRTACSGAVGTMDNERTYP